MSDTIEETPVVSVDEVSIARLHGLACWTCGAVSGELAPSRRIREATSGHIWTTALCAGCRHLPVSS
ncbi:hypothetical protein [Streptomyces sp. NPDC050264]|uniref:hypothetical protein n=1 Tax=Streptomyces sp. NPDC050264 TaxID=3155038 RepID=UPI003445D2A1